MMSTNFGNPNQAQIIYIGILSGAYYEFDQDGVVANACIDWKTEE